MAKQAHGQGIPPVDDLDLATKKYVDDNGGGGSGALSGALELLDVIEVSAPVTSVSFGFGGDGLFNRSLNGDSDESYVLEFWIPDPGGTAFIKLQPNGITADQASGRTYAGSSTGISSQADLSFAQVTTGRVTGGKVEIQAKSGNVRSFQSVCALAVIPETTASVWSDIYAGVWDDTSTVITSLDIVSSLASGIVAGAWFKLYRRKPQANLAQAADVPRGMEFVDKIIVGGDTDRVSFGAGGDGVYGAALDGDADEEYFLSWRTANCTATVSLSIEPNGSTANLFGSRQFGGSSNGGDNSSNWRVGDTTSGYQFMGSASIFARSGGRRFMTANVCQYQGGSRWHISFAGTLDETAANITSLDIVASVASQLKAGSEIYLWRRRAIPTNGVVAKTVLSADATTLSITGLDGDSDGEYEVTGSLRLVGTASQDISLQINGATTNVILQRDRGGTLSVGSIFASLSGSVTTPHEVHFKMRIWARRTLNGQSVRRALTGHVSQIFNSGDQILLTTLAGHYDDVAANLTSIGIVNNIASGILIGSEVTIRKVSS